MQQKKYLVRLSLILSLLFIVSCKPKRPSGEVCNLDLSTGLCYRLQTPKNAGGEWKYIGDIENSKLDKHFVITPEYMQALIKYWKKLERYVDDQCR